jgi:transcription initiation factor IIE alpha subunit
MDEQLEKELEEKIKGLNDVLKKLNEAGLRVEINVQKFQVSDIEERLVAIDVEVYRRFIPGQQSLR